MEFKCGKHTLYKQHLMKQYSYTILETSQKNCCRVKKYLQGLIVNGEQLDKAGRREEQKVDNAL